MPASATAGSPRTPYPSLPQAWVSQSLLISCYFNPVLSEQRTDVLRWPTRRGGTKSKAEPRELCEQRREREIAPSSLRSSGLNLHNQLDIRCICGIPEYTMNHPKIEAMDIGSNDIYIYFSFFSFCDCLYICFCVWFCLSFWFLFSTVFSAFITGGILFWFGYSLLSCLLLFSSFLFYYFEFFYFQKLFFILMTFFSFLFFLSFFSPFYSEPCG